MSEKFDSKKLLEVSRAANEKAIIAAQGEDGGTCNLDAVFLVLPDVRAQVVIQAIEAGGLHAYKTRWVGSMGYMINPSQCGQADSRVRACKAIYEEFKAAGYEVYNFCAMD